MFGQVLAYFCYNYYDQFIGPRFWYEITGPAMILSACALSPLIGHSSSGAAGEAPAIHPPTTIRLGAILILVFFSLYGFLYSMHPKLRSFQVVASHGLELKRSLEHAPFENSILILPQYYQDWAWLWGPKFEGQYYFIRDRFEEGNQWLKRQYPDRRFFKFSSTTHKWEQI